MLALLMLVGRAMVGPLFAQSAWNNVTFTAGEVRDPGKNLPRALLLGCGLVVTFYLLANLAYVVTLPLSGIQNAPQNRVATAVMQAVLGQQRHCHHGARDHDFDVWLQQWTDTGRRARLLCDGA